MNNEVVKVTPAKFPCPGAPGKQFKRTNTMTVKLILDTTEFKDKLNRIEKQVDRIIDKITFLKFERDLDKVKNVVINNDSSNAKIADKILKKLEECREKLK
ncbi:hypothetical protein [Clostridium tetani]|uniref:Uncharacterized protein n=1 Tax=Clostridium tetani TaxID=1513 RepID=A0ABC8EFU1_CLOTA|nr:hypothetical protein [Clostridium tetani]BDR82543.1 hypothetical protein K234311028_p20260 [Clostridium tetani]